jgi:DNA-directed RNA polymerase subunit RPC12/RpoP
MRWFSSSYVRCAYCNETRIVARKREWANFALRLFGFRPYRCLTCLNEFVRPVFLRQRLNPDISYTGPDPEARPSRARRRHRRSSSDGDSSSSSGLLI